MKKFPKTLYVTHEEDGELSYLNAYGEVPDVDEDTPLAIYQLVELAEIVVTREVKKQEIKKGK